VLLTLLFCAKLLTTNEKVILNYLRISCFPFSLFKIGLFSNTLKKLRAMNNQSCRVFWRQPILSWLRS